MSTLLAFLKLPKNRGIFFWIKYYWNQFLDAIYHRKVSNKVDNSWKGVKISKTITPEGWNSENAFEFLGKEYNGTIMKRFKD